MKRMCIGCKRSTQPRESGTGWESLLLGGWREEEGPAWSGQSPGYLGEGRRQKVS